MSEQPEGRIAMRRDEHASESERSIFERAHRRYGWVPNTIRVMVRSRSAAELYVTADELNAQTSLSGLERELLAVVTSSYNECEYCLTAHSLALVGLGASGADIADARNGTSSVPRARALLAFAVAALRHRGAVPDREFDAALVAGLERDTLLDVVAVVIENSLGNYINNLAGTPVDPVLQRAASRHLQPAAAGVAR
jgi:uncharacterized peroxidase-related enzyme